MFHLQEVGRSPLNSITKDNLYLMLTFPDSSFQKYIIKLHIIYKTFHKNIDYITILFFFLYCSKTWKSWYSKFQNIIAWTLDKISKRTLSRLTQQCTYRKSRIKYHFRAIMDAYPEMEFPLFLPLPVSWVSDFSWTEVDWEDDSMLGI